jgi:hypothetical protein
MNSTNSVAPRLTEKQKATRTIERIRVSTRLLDAIQPVLAQHLNTPDVTQWALYEIGQRLRNDFAFAEAVEDLDNWREHFERIIRAHDRMERYQGYVHGQNQRPQREFRRS